MSCFKVERNGHPVLWPLYLSKCVRIGSDWNKNEVHLGKYFEKEQFNQ